MDEGQAMRAFRAMLEGGEGEFDSDEDLGGESEEDNVESLAMLAARKLLEQHQPAGGNAQHEEPVELITNLTKKDKFTLAAYNRHRDAMKTGDLVLFDDSHRLAPDTLVEVTHLGVVRVPGGKSEPVLYDALQPRHAEDIANVHVSGEALQRRILEFDGDMWWIRLEHVDAAAQAELDQFLRAKDHMAGVASSLSEQFNRGKAMVDPSGKTSLFRLAPHDLANLLMQQFIVECLKRLNIEVRGSVTLGSLKGYARPVLLRDTNKLKLYDKVQVMLKEQQEKNKSRESLDLRKKKEEEDALDPAKNKRFQRAVNLSIEKYPHFAAGLPTRFAHQSRAENVLMPQGDLVPTWKRTYRDVLTGMRWERKRSWNPFSRFVRFECRESDFSQGVGSFGVRVHKLSLMKNGTVPQETWVSVWYNYRDRRDSGVVPHLFADVLPRWLPQRCLKPDEFEYKAAGAANGDNAPEGGAAAGAAPQPQTHQKVDQRGAGEGGDSDGDSDDDGPGDKNRNSRRGVQHPGMLGARLNLTTVQSSP